MKFIIEVPDAVIEDLKQCGINPNQAAEILWVNIRSAQNHYEMDSAENILMIEASMKKFKIEES